MRIGHISLSVLLLPRQVESIQQTTERRHHQLLQPADDLYVNQINQQLYKTINNKLNLSDRIHTMAKKSLHIPERPQRKRPQETKM